MKRILYIATSNINLKTGGGIANLALLNSLSKDYADLIDVVTYEESFNGLQKPANFYFVPPITLIGKLKNICMGRIHRFTPWLDNFLRHNHNRYSHCFINSGLLGEYIDVFHEYGIKVTVIHHNFECEFQIDNKRPSTFWGMTDFLVRNSERKSYLKSDLNLFLSQDDINIFHKNYLNSKILKEFAIGIFEPQRLPYTNSARMQLSENQLAICGSLNSVQTRVGLFDFHKKYLPIVNQIYGGNYHLKIAGRNPAKDLVDLFSNDSTVQIYANPESMSEILSDSSIFICPTNVGGGIKLRILDGLKLGMPILTHVVSARGYNVLHDCPWFQIYNDEDSFRTGLINIKNEISANPCLRKEIIEMYMKHFSFEHGDEVFRKLSREFLLEEYLK